MSYMNLPAISNEAGLTRYLEEIRHFPMLEPEEEYMLARRWSEHADYDAAHKLVTSHLRLVPKIASGFRGYGLPIGELISEGNIGLMQAVKKFDPEKGFRLSTYAIWWIRAAIQEYILRSWSLVKIGTSATQKKLFFNLRKLKKRIQHMTHGRLTPEQAEEIADQLNVSAEEVVDMESRLSSSDQSLHTPLTLDGEAERIDFLETPEDDQETVLADRQIFEQRQTLLKDAMAKLNERERRIIQTRQLQEPPLTLEDLSAEFGVSRERIRQIEARALEKLTAHMHAA